LFNRLLFGKYSRVWAGNVKEAGQGVIFLKGGKTMDWVGRGMGMQYVFSILTNKQTIGASAKTIVLCVD